MDLLNQIENIWANGAEKKASEWAKNLKNAKPMIVKAKARFHEWYPLKVYLSYTSATKSCIKFSLRYLGQEVALLSVSDDYKDVMLEISDKTAQNNTKYFNMDLQGKFSWSGYECRSFRKHFKFLDPQIFQDSVRSEERHIESMFLQHMADSNNGKFNGTLKGIQPVLLEGCPFQFPLPISGSSGEPKKNNGNIDILARRGVGKGTKISIWELKKPKTTAHAIEQVYIYGVTLLKMLRIPETGNIWYRDIIGFGRNVPDRLTIECVVAVSIANQKNRELFEEKLRVFNENNCLVLGNDSLKFIIAHYEKNPVSINLKELC